MSVTYGQTPGIEVTLEGGTIQGVEVGEEEKLVIFGRGDTGNGSAQTNEYKQVQSGQDAETFFGAGSELAKALKDALSNGANSAYLYGVMPATQSVTDEDITGGGDAADSTGGSAIGNAPLIEDTNEITVEDDTGTVMTVKFAYSDVAGMPAPGADEIFINPLTGAWKADTADNYNIDYKYLDWSTAFDAADMVLNEGESGVYWALSDAESVGSTLAGKAEQLRDPDYKMVKSCSFAQPNDNTSESPPDPMFDTGAYTDGIDSLPHFLFAPGRQEDTVETVGGALGGLTAGNALENPIYGDHIEGVDLETGKNDEARLTHSERSDLRSAYVIPLKNEGAIEVDGSLSTYEQANWETDFQTVRVIDRAVLLVRAVGQAIRGDLDTDGADEIAAEEAQARLEDLADRGLLKANTRDETNLYVRPAGDDTQGTIALEVGVTPIQAVETFKTTITINS